MDAPLRGASDLADSSPAVTQRAHPSSTRPIEMSPWWIGERNILIRTFSATEETFVCQERGEC